MKGVKFFFCLCSFLLYFILVCEKYEIIKNKFHPRIFFFFFLFSFFFFLFFFFSFFLFFFFLFFFFLFFFFSFFFFFFFFFFLLDFFSVVECVGFFFLDKRSRREEGEKKNKDRTVNNRKNKETKRR